ncbi:MAG TPA: hypothetical protein VL049_18385 [Candidatus Dormibacteraeota bacterium]|nr:hypothetical protein [Candidatus Dormibacteraeota bacterium]
MSRATATYQFGDAVLHMDADDPALLAAFPRRYGDCAVAPPAAPDAATVRCTMRRSVDPQLVVLTFHAGAPADAAAAAYNLLRPTCAVPPFRVWDSPVAGWRLTGGATGPLLAACGAKVLLHPKLVPYEFLVEFLVGITLGAQSGTLPIHGASLRMGEAGVVLVGASRAGKTTTSLHLAARGHTLLGDEIALIRLATSEIIPFRRAVNIRPGPYGDDLAGELGLSAADVAAASDADITPRRIGELFPRRPARPAPLRAAFFLAGFAEQPSIEPFQLTFDQTEVFDWITTPEIAYCSWGVAPGRRAVRLLALRQTLARIPCWQVKVGPPRDTVALIERTMEERSC